MIIEFTISNFRSIKDEQTFSLYAATPGNHLALNIASAPAPGGIYPLKSAGVYGANASGKTNLLLAFRALQYLLARSGSLKDGEPIKCYEPYLLSGQTQNAPVRLALEFQIANGSRYLYTVAFLQNRIVEERLDLYRTARIANLFDRRENDTWESIKFGPFLKGGTRKFPFFANNAYLSKAGNSADAPEIIRDAYNYILRDITHLGIDDDISFGNDIYSKPGVLEKVARLLSLIDTGVANVKVENQEVKEADFSFSPNIPEGFRKRIMLEQSRKFLFDHKTDANDTVAFERGEESKGTLKMFDLAPLLIDVFENGGVLIIDELDRSMHPHMAELIIKLFNDPEVNPGGAQLIFSTHNANLMSPDLLRRDQIWFAEKSNGASRFFSLDDFDKKKVTPTSPFARWYAEGRFGAIPSIDYGGVVKLLRKRQTNA